MKLPEERKRLLTSLEAELEKQIIGQPCAIAAAAPILLRGELGLAEPGRPKGSFLFLGPTGVGKTQLAKSFTRLLFPNDQEALAVLDMSEFQGANSVANLIGSPSSPGRLHHYLGRGVKTFVFDEIEKAHRPLLDLLLQILDEARLTLNDGQVFDFQGQYIVMTSNLASLAILKAQAGSRTTMERFVRKQTEQFLRPELLARIDAVEVFRPLTFADRIRIGRIIAAREIERLRAFGITEIKPLEDTILALCAKDCEFGARPLRRRIQSLLQERAVSASLFG